MKFIITYIFYLSRSIKKFFAFVIVALTTIFFCSNMVASSTILLQEDLHMGDHSYMNSFSIIHRFSVMYHINALKKYNIHGHQLGYIYYICDSPGLSQEKLASHLKLNKASVAKGLRSLISAGYVRRVQNQKDRRAYQLFPTQKAEALSHECMQTIEGFNEILTKGMTDEEKAMFRELVIKARNNVMNAAGKDRGELHRPGPAPEGPACPHHRPHPHRP